MLRWFAVWIQKGKHPFTGDIESEAEFIWLITMPKELKANYLKSLITVQEVQAPLNS